MVRATVHSMIARRAAYTNAAKATLWTPFAANSRHSHSIVSRPLNVLISHRLFGLKKRKYRRGYRQNPSLLILLD
jgi:hypothetical protein